MERLAIHLDKAVTFDLLTAFDTFKASFMPILIQNEYLLALY